MTTLPGPLRIEALLTGRAVGYTRPGSRSAIDKRPLAGAVQIGPDGIVGDEQGDLRVHGGPDKAIHHYPFDHYPAWQADLGAHPLLAQPGAFGENISTRGLTEADICIGDRLRVGDVVLEVSQLRQPCWKLNDRFAQRDMARRVQQTGRTGWYYRVLQGGTLRAGDALAWLERPWPQWPLARVLEVFYRNMLDADALGDMLALPLTPSWRKLVENRLARGEVERWDKRIEGPAHAPLGRAPDT
ncbi:MOSC domain-containing protein [Ralstonia solanacearum]|uniref:MOSC domain-containing protein n=1 Tax=Ralstonia solanacearum TaxID=305 RepID=UPI00078E1E5A|nr:MOSC domain-containing protein [Ralstonia solanacearum]AMP37998.1 molybdenum cofactor sulfurase [Ralstonia solanacearum]AXV86823.1 MOSC domain-containing protein [Ralstonia solanacearum]AXW06319.1 MOSC domain-containing protein [Ralstonia solanacearum]AXW24063.1 MOSC domain-containing protein [Ralstonia solanacearum]AXW80997.1 MOSC domain-containing protein [Ralstonia solanacearum]